MTATVEKLQGPATRIEGFVDALDGGRLFGWAWDRLHPDERLHVEISVGDRLVAVVTADLARSDLAANGIGDGRHAFELDLNDLMPAEGAPGAVAVSPSTGERTPLKLRGPEEQSAETVALLRQVAGAIDVLGRGQRRLGAALSGRAGASETELIHHALAELAEAQRELRKQQDSMEVFLVRFDSLLRELAERMEAPPPPRAACGLVGRLMGLWFK